MSNKKQTPFDKIDWLDIQKKYLDALIAFNTSNQFKQMQNPFAQMQNPFTQTQNPFAQMQNPFAQTQNPFAQMQNPFAQMQNPFVQTNKPSFDSFWVNAMNDWWKSIKPETAHKYESLFEKVLDQCRGYYFMSEQFSNLVEGMANLKNKNEDITAYINDKFKEMESAFSATQNNFNWSRFIDTFEHPIELMKGSFANLSLYGNDMFSEVSPEVQKLRDKFLSIPGLGYSRETQDKVQEAIRLWANYQDNFQEYQSVMAQLNQNALELMRKRIIDMSKENEDMNSMREMYDLWVESNEKVYGDYVYTDEYSELNGRLVNSLMAFKNKNQEITEDVLSAMNMPTSDAINELERRQYELRKQVKTLQRELREALKKSPRKSNVAVTTKKKTVPSVKKKKKTKSETKPRLERKKKTKKKTSKKKVKASSNNKDMINLKF